MTISTVEKLLSQENGNFGNKPQPDVMKPVPPSEQQNPNQNSDQPKTPTPENKTNEQPTASKPFQQPLNTQPQMSNSNSQVPNTKPKKKISWGKLIMWSLLILLVVMMFYAIFAPPSAEIWTVGEFNTFFTNNWAKFDWGLVGDPTTYFVLTDYGSYVQLTFYYQIGGDSQTPIVIYFDTYEHAYEYVTQLQTIIDSSGSATPINLLDYTYTNVYTGPGWFATFLMTWLPWIIFMVLAMLIVKKIIDKQQGQGKIQKRLIPQISNVKFNDISGYSEVKQEMLEIVDFLKQPMKYASLGIRTPKGVLLTGQPGTGKTLWAKAVAGEAGVPFYSISGSDFVEMYVGVGASRVRSLFEAAKVSGASIIFIDEIDAVGRQRGAGLGGGNDEREQTLNQLLVEMDGFSASNGVIVMAATNRPDVLDPALKRPGRFDREILIRLPDILEREAILRNYASRGNKKLSPTLDFKLIAMRTPGFSGAELENVVNEAAILGVRTNSPEITIDIIDEAIDRVMGGPSKTNNIITMEEKKQIAYHEAGHAIIGLVKENSQQVQKISIIPRGQAGGYVLMIPKKEKMIQTKTELLAKITSYLGGRASEFIFYGADNVSTGASNDIQEATHIARKMVTEFGMSDLGPIQYEERQGSMFLGREIGRDKLFSSAKAKEIDDAVKTIVDKCMNEAIDIISKNKDIMHIFAEALVLKETLNFEEIEFIYKNKKLTDEIEEIKTSLKKQKEDAKKHLKDLELSKADSLKKEHDEKYKNSEIDAHKAKWNNDNPEFKPNS